jgi:uncharacterized membrane protein YhaH (DUF805 family)
MQEMSEKSAVHTFLQSFFTLSGRSPRREYWLVSLGIYIGWTLLLMGVSTDFRSAQLSGTSQSKFIEFLLFLPATLLTLPVNVRRLHDLNLSGWWVILCNILEGIPTINILIAFAEFVVFGCIKGTLGPNKFGNDPIQKPQRKHSVEVESPEERLLKLAELRKNGVITEEEYEEKRKKLLDKI